MNNMADGLMNGNMSQPTPTPIPTTSHDTQAATDHTSAVKTVRWPGNEKEIIGLQKTSLSIGK